MSSTLDPVTGHNSLQPREASGRLPQVLLFIYLTLKPIYLWSSGLPQVADMFMVAFIVQQLLSRQRNPQSIRTRSFILAVTFFAYWTALVNVVAAFAVGEPGSFLTSTLMVCYNGAVSIAVLGYALQHGRAALRGIYFGALISLLIQLVLVALSTATGGARATGTFNNPNQLAYHALLVLCILLISHDVIHPPIWHTIVGTFSAVFLTAFSLSRAGLLGVGVVLVGAILWPPGGSSDKRALRRVLLTAVCLFSGLLISTELVTSSQWFQDVSLRADKEDPRGFENTRGYNRIFEHPQYWITGAGEGANSRFGSTNELHSTLGNVQLSYGAIGLLLYLVIIFMTMKAARFRFAYTIMGILVYGLAHNGIRHSLAWMLLALLVYLGIHGKQAVQRDVERVRLTRVASGFNAGTQRPPMTRPVARTRRQRGSTPRCGK